MSRFYIPLDKITGTKILPDFSPITSISDNGLDYAFYGCTGLTGSISFPNLTTINSSGLNGAFQGCTGITSVSFPNLDSIGVQGLYRAFYYCTGLTGSVSFPNLTTIGDTGLRYVFQGCSKITKVYFKSSLSGNAQCTRSYMGCSKATIYFNLP